MKLLKELLDVEQYRLVSLLADGFKNNEIAELVGTTEFTVKNKLRVVYDIAGCFNRVELALRFVSQEGIEKCQ